MLVEDRAQRREGPVAVNTVPAQKLEVIDIGRREGGTGGEDRWYSAVAHQLGKRILPSEASTAERREADVSADAMAEVHAPVPAHRQRGQADVNVAVRQHRHFNTIRVERGRDSQVSSFEDSVQRK